MTPVADASAFSACDGPVSRGTNAMDIQKTHGDRVESLLRGMLAFVLLVAVAWAYAQGNPVTG